MPELACRPGDPLRVALPPTAATSNAPAPSTTNEPDRTSSPGDRVDSSRLARQDRLVEPQPGRVRERPVRDDLVAWRSRTRSPTTTSRDVHRRAPLRHARRSRCGATSAASSVELRRCARSSCQIPIPVFVTTIPRKSASRQSPKTSVRRPSESRIALNGVIVFARTIVAVERLAGGSGGVPRAARRAAASASVRPCAHRAELPLVTECHARAARPCRSSARGSRSPSAAPPSPPRSRGARRVVAAGPAPSSRRAAPA